MKPLLMRKALIVGAHRSSMPWTLLLCPMLFLLLSGCDGSESPGTPENLRADYERLKKDCEEQKEELEQLWRQRMTDKDTKIADLTAENANLRQRLLAVESALNEVPLVQVAKERAVVWVHVVYWLIIATCIVTLAVLLWMHANLRERVRLYVMRTAKAIPSGEIDNDTT